MSFSKFSNSIPFTFSRFIPWIFMILGTIFAGFGIGGMIFAGVGASPLDAFFASFASRFGFTPGVVLIVFSFIFVAIAWILGTKPGIGTVFSFIGIGVFLDLALLFWTLLAVPSAFIISFTVWIFSFLIFALGVVLLLSSTLGASPYDQIVKSVSSRFSISLGRSRLFFDFSFVVLAFLILGFSALSFVNIGTVLILLSMPLILNKWIPFFDKFVK